MTLLMRFDVLIAKYGVYEAFSMIGRKDIADQAAECLSLVQAYKRDSSLPFEVWPIDVSKAFNFLNKELPLLVEQYEEELGFVAVKSYGMSSRKV